MARLQSAFRLFIQYSSSIFDKLIKPNPFYVKDQIQYELDALRNKSILIIQLLLCLCSIVTIIINPASYKTNLTHIGISMGVCLTLVLSCKYHPQIFKIFYTVSGLGFGPFIMHTTEEGIIKAWLGSIIIPTSFYAFSGSISHFLIQIIFHSFFLINLYSGPMERALTYMAPETFISTLRQISIRIMFFTAFFVIFLHYFIRISTQKIITIEKKKEELECQKTFILSFSHEIRNLINSLTGNIKLASLVENISPRVKELLLNAEVCGEVLLHLVNNILDTGKVEIGELEINPAPTRIYDTFEKLWGVCSELIRRKNLQGKIKMSKDLPKTMKIDHYRLTQILLNLVGNSIKFTDRGSININVSWVGSEQNVIEKCFQPYPFNERDEHDEGLFEKESSFSSLDERILCLDFHRKRVNSSLLRPSVCRANRGILKIIVSDTGCGMDEQELSQLFQKFSQVHSDATKRKLGTGLGLFITKELCTKMHGEIRVFSKKGKGSAFIVCLPVGVILEEDNQEVLWDENYLKNFIKGQRLKAMIVDDISFNHALLKGYFDELGIEVIDIAMNGIEAYQKYVEQTQQGNRPHIITMDLDMAVMNGKESTKRIRQFESEQGLTRCLLSMISGNCTESEIAECLDRQGTIKADNFIKKPVSLEELMRVIGHHFIHAQTR